jgi:uncharacterized protein
MLADESGLEAFVKKTEDEPQGLLDLLGGRRSHKVGPAFEALVEWGLVHGLGYECLGRDLQIYDGKRTMGALDLLLRSRGGQVEHWELAYKLYLQADGGAGWESWVGPNERDRLSLKVAKMLDHQLPLSTKPEAREVLARLGVGQVDTHRVLLLGTLFKPWRQEPSLATDATQPSQGRWAHVSEAEEIAALYPGTRWSKREKPHWFGPWGMENSSVSASELVQSLEGDAPGRPQLWTCRGVLNGPLFFVSDSWGRGLG